jgi:hypothetical protein
MCGPNRAYRRIIVALALTDREAEPIAPPKRDRSLPRALDCGNLDLGGASTRREEGTMNRLPFAIVAQLAVIVVAGSCGDALPASAKTTDSLHAPYYVIDGAGRKRLVYRSANSCAPLHGHAVWGPGHRTAHPLGYHCERSPN